MKKLVDMILLLLAVGLLGACGVSQASPILAASSVTPTVIIPAATSWYVFPEDEAKTLASLQQVDEYPLYVMHYYKEYASRPTPGLSGAREALPPPGWGCSLFSVLVDEDHLLYGRNFDWEYGPALLLVTNPPDGYASVSMVNLGFLGFSDEKAAGLMDLPLEQRAGLLGAPHLPFDGMNEHGLAIAMAAVPSVTMPTDPSKDWIGSIEIIREVLDHARDVDEAVALIEAYNIDFRGGPTIHYLIADAGGRAVLVEFYRGEMHLFENEQPWHSATNFQLVSVDDPAGQCWRYDRLDARLSESGGMLDMQAAMALLGEVSQDITQWSVVYDMAHGELDVAMGREYADVHTFRLADFLENR